MFIVLIDTLPIKSLLTMDCLIYLMPLNCALKISWNNKFYVYLKTKKLAKNLNRHFCKEDVQITSKEKWIYGQCD